MRLSGTRVTAIAQGQGLGSQLWDLAGARPSLDLRFADSKSLVDATTGQNLVTFTRASSGTYVGSDGLIKTATNNEARFDHNPTTRESLGLLVEESRTNLLLRSEEFDNASWTTNKSAITVTANQALAPDGTTTAESLVPDSGVTVGPSGTNSFIRQDITKAASAITYTLSFYAKAFGYAAIRIVQRDSASSTNFGAVTFSLSDGSILNGPTAAGTFTSASASTVALANSWYRCQLTFTTGTETANRILVVPATSTNTSANGTSGVYLWGAQLEAGSFPTSYIPTTGSTVTRSADVASISGSNFSSWYRQDEGTVSISARTNATHGGVNSFPRIHAISDGTNDNVIQNYYRVLSGYTDAGYGVTTLTVAQAGIDTNNERNGQSQSTAYANNDFAFAINGSLVNTDNTGTVPTVSQLRLGARGTGLGPLNGTIRRLTYWPQRLPNETLQAVTQ
jgi:hypothetical protein